MNRRLFTMVFALLCFSMKEAEGEGVISAVQGDYVVMSLGSLDGVKVGDRFFVYRRESLVHPLTGKMFDLSRVRVAEVEVREVGNLFSMAALASMEMPIRRGDLVVPTSAIEKEEAGKMAGRDTTDTSAVKAAMGPSDTGQRTKATKPVRRKVTPRKARSDVRVARQVKPVAPDTMMTTEVAVKSTGGETTTPVEEELNTRYQSAMTYLKQSGKGRDPKTVDAHYWSGQYYFRKGSYAKAAEHFKKVVENRTEASKRYNALFNLAMCYYHLNKGEPAQLDQAKEVFQRVVREFPKTSIAIEASQWLETIEWLQRAGMKRQQNREAAPSKVTTAAL
ncbi:MAG: tetratricopeptide repeat protein [Candidatus Latescibacteria bacterium]|nr:tetratricopeptide repeat protein [Candidatus Latescibacterota bacterium]